MAMLNNQMVPISWGFSSTLRRKKKLSRFCFQSGHILVLALQMPNLEPKKSMYVYYSMHIYIYIYGKAMYMQSYIYYVTFYGKAI